MSRLEERAMRRQKQILVTSLVLAAALAADGCSRRRAANTPQPQPAPPFEEPAAVTPAPPAPRANASQPVVDPPVAALSGDDLEGRNLEELNRDSPLRPAFFVLDSAELDDEARIVVAANADVLKKNPQWVITIEGHCDERGTAEYNLALGERRAMAAKAYLQSLGVSPDRLRTVSYGDEYPFDRAHAEDAWSRNRRAHFIISAK
jgi:peptidoglycan-associated lipoprotein